MSASLYRFVTIVLIFIVCLSDTGRSQQQASDKKPLRHWYVSGKGNDQNDGKTLGSAFRSLAKAGSLVAPGDEVLVADGIYSDMGQGNGSAVLSIKRSGTPEAWISWRAMPGQHPDIRPKGWNGIAVLASYQVFEGLTITGANDSITLIAAIADAKNKTPNPAFNTNGITVEGRNNPANAKPHHIIIRNCSISKCPGGGIAVLEGDYITIEDCRVFENAWYMRYGGSGITTLNNWAFDDDPGYHIIIQRNLVWNNKTMVPWDVTGKLSDGNGILLDVTDLKKGATNPNADSVIAKKDTALTPTRPEWKGRALIANNVSAFNGGSGIHTFRTRHVDIINNTTYWNGQVVGYQELFPNNCDDIVILNNVMVPRPGGKVTSNNRNTNIKWDYNVYPQAQKDFPAPHDLIADPLLEVSAGPLIPGSFRLKKGSPALNSGTLELAQPLDVSRHKRPAGTAADRGAYEQ